MPPVAAGANIQGETLHAKGKGLPYATAPELVESGSEATVLTRRALA